MSEFTVRRAVLASWTAVVVVALVGCASDDTHSERTPETVDYASVQRESGMASRATTYNSVRDLRADAELVVLATGTGTLREDEAGNQYTPLGNTEVVVKRSLYGSDVQEGDHVTVFVEGWRDTDGTLHQDKIAKDKTYVLFLQRLHPDDPSNDVYAVTGYLAGAYEAVAPGKFGRMDPDSPNLPIGLDVDSQGLVTQVR